MKWPTLAAFHAADPRRGHSAEVQIGSEWKTDDAVSLWRAAWLEATGEFIIARHGDGESGPVEVLGVLPDRFTVEVGLRGWWHTCGHLGSPGLAAPHRDRARRSRLLTYDAGWGDVLWIVDTARRSVIVAARSAVLARQAVWQATGIKYAADSEILEYGDVIVVADAVSDAEAERLSRLLGSSW